MLTIGRWETGNTENGVQYCMCTWSYMWCICHMKRVLLRQQGILDTSDFTLIQIFYPSALILDLSERNLISLWNCMLLNLIFKIVQFAFSIIKSIGDVTSPELRDMLVCYVRTRWWRISYFKFNIHVEWWSETGKSCIAHIVLNQTGYEKVACHRLQQQ